MDYELTYEQKQKFKDWIEAKAALIGKCPVCHSRHWTVLDHFVDLPIYRGGALVAGGVSYPNVGMICGNCGNTQLINAVASGIVQQSEQLGESDD